MKLNLEMRGEIEVRVFIGAVGFGVVVLSKQEKRAYRPVTAREKGLQGCVNSKRRGAAAPSKCP